MQLRKEDTQFEPVNGAKVEISGWKMVVAVPQLSKCASQPG